MLTVHDESFLRYVTGDVDSLTSTPGYVDGP